VSGHFLSIDVVLFVNSAEIFLLKLFIFFVDQFDRFGGLVVIFKSGAK